MDGAYSSNFAVGSHSVRSGLTVKFGMRIARPSLKHVHQYCSVKIRGSFCTRVNRLSVKQDVVSGIHVHPC